MLGSQDYIVKRGKCHQVGSEFKSHVTYQNAFDPPLCSGGLEKPKAHQGTCPACPPGTRRCHPGHLMPSSQHMQSTLECVTPAGPLSPLTMVPHCQPPPPGTEVYGSHW